MFTGTAVFDLLLPSDSRTLKIKRSYIKPILAVLRKLEVSAAEVGDTEVHGRSQIGVAVVSGDHFHATEVIAACERQVAGRPEVELLSVHRRTFGSEDDE